VIETDDEARAKGAVRVIDVEFINSHTTGFDDDINVVRETP